MTRSSILRSALPVVAIVAFVATLGAVLWSAGSTVGYDFHAYGDAARRLLDGRPLYDSGVDVAGGFAIYLYPPPFALAIVPFAWVGGQTAVWLWTGLLIGAFLVGVAALPVSSTIRWLVLLLAALDWPFLYSLKLGQVGPILFLLFGLGWRWLDRPIGLGVSIGLGTLVKLQPALLGLWAAMTGRWRAAGVAVAVIAIAALAATVVAGIQPWVDYPALLGRVSSPLTTPHNFTPGAVAWQAGASPTIAGGIQAVATVLALVAVVVAARFDEADASYLVTVVASQLVSPLLWDHYAMLLLLPVAWLLERGHAWAVLVPLATSILLTGIAPPIVYPLVFGVCLVAPLAVGRRRGVGTRGAMIGSPA